MMKEYRSQSHDMTSVLIYTVTMWKSSIMYVTTFCNKIKKKILYKFFVHPTGSYFLDAPRMFGR
jgi:hypothetical protein